MKTRKKIFIAITVILLLVVFTIGAFLVIRYVRNRGEENDNNEQAYTGLELDKNLVSYEEVQPGTFKINVLTDQLGTITRIKISPDGEMMLVSDLAGTVWVFRKEQNSEGIVENDGNFVKQEKPFYKIETGFTGFPNENGLTGIAFGADFSDSKDIFLLYAIDLGKDGAKNRITRISYEEDGSGNLVGTDPVNVFAGAHQIQNGLGVMIQGKPHLLFSLGENYNPPDSKDLTKEAGKIMLIQRDGSDPVGTRPFSGHPKICTKGIRNVYGFDIDLNDPELRVAFLDNGPNLNDRLGYAKLIDPDGELAGGYDFNWDGEDDPITKVVPDINVQSSPNSLLHIWDQTVSPDEVIFYPGKGTIPASDDKTSYALVLLFGQTGTSDNEKGKEILLAKIDRSSFQPKVSFTTLIHRSDKATEFAGNPLGLAYDPVTLKIYFGDLVEGRIYEVEPL